MKMNFPVCLIALRFLETQSQNVSLLLSCDIFLSLSLKNNLFFHEEMYGGETQKSPLPAPPPLMYTRLRVTRGFKDSWMSSFYNTETLRCFMRPLHTLPCLCPIHWRRLNGHLHVFCHTSEEFSICAMCDFNVVSLQKNGRKGSFCSAALFHTNSVYRM